MAGLKSFIAPRSAAVSNGRDRPDLCPEPHGPSARKQGDMDVVIHIDQIPELDELISLYDSVGWTAYTREPETLRRALKGSSRVVTAYEGKRLIGLARIISDGATIA